MRICSQTLVRSKRGFHTHKKELSIKNEYVAMFHGNILGHKLTQNHISFKSFPMVSFLLHSKAPLKTISEYNHGLFSLPFNDCHNFLSLQSFYYHCHNSGPHHVPQNLSSPFTKYWSWTPNCI